MGDKRNDWHSGAYAALQLDLRDNWDILEFYEEYQLTEQPLKIDCVVLKKISDQEVKSGIGKFFKKYNIVEYKSPTDSLNLNTLYKVLVYGFMYVISPRHKGMSIIAEDITLTMIRAKKPIKLFRELDLKGFTLIQIEKGIYSLKGFPWIDIQFIVSDELDDKEHIQLKVLTNDLQKGDYVKFLDFMLECEGNEKQLADIVLQSFSEVNSDTISLWKENENMCEAMRKIMAEELQEAEYIGMQQGQKQGRIDICLDMVKEGLISIQIAAQKLNMSEKAIKEML